MYTYFNYSYIFWHFEYNKKLNQYIYIYFSKILNIYIIYLYYTIYMFFDNFIIKNIYSIFFWKILFLIWNCNK